MKRIDVRVYLTLFFVSFFAELFFVSHYEEDFISIIGLGTIMLVSLYFAVGSVKERINAEQERLYQVLLDHGTSGHSTGKENHLTQQFERIENVNKAAYVSTKKNITQLSESLDGIKGSLQIIEEIHNDSTEEILKKNKQLLELNEKLYDNQMALYESLKDQLHLEAEESKGTKKDPE